MPGFINKLRSKMGAFGAFVEESSGDDLFPTACVKNDPLKRSSEKFKLPPPTSQKKKRT